MRLSEGSFGSIRKEWQTSGESVSTLSARFNKSLEPKIFVITPYQY